MNAAAEKIMHNSIPVPEAGCWLWLASGDQKGYGQTSVGGVSQRAHRASYEAFVGPIPPGMDICHKCDTPACVNPDHLFAGTRSDNMIDCSNKGRFPGQRITHCRHGHEYTPENIRVTSNGWRECRTCARDGARARMRKSTAARRAAGIPDKPHRKRLAAANPAAANAESGK